MTKLQNKCPAYLVQKAMLQENDRRRLDFFAIHQKELIHANEVPFGEEVLELRCNLYVERAQIGDISLHRSDVK